MTATVAGSTVAFSGSRGKVGLAMVSVPFDGRFVFIYLKALFYPGTVREVKKYRVKVAL